jgi:hypothetical protein
MAKVFWGNISKKIIFNEKTAPSLLLTGGSL